jgi:hypothetical protein
MTISFNDLNASAMMSGEALIAELNRSILGMQKAKTGTSTKYTNWRARANAGPAGETPSGLVFETLFMSLMFHSLFGMPMFSGLGLGQEAATGLGALGSALHHDMAPHDMNTAEHVVNTALLAEQKKRFEAISSAQNAQLSEFGDMKKMLMLLMAWMMAQQQSGKSGSGDSEQVAPDVLRHPKLARFKQNRHSMDCIRSLFKDQAATVTPLFKAPSVG